MDLLERAHVRDHATLLRLVRETARKSEKMSIYCQFGEQRRKRPEWRKNIPINVREARTSETTLNDGTNVREEAYVL